MSEKKRVLLVDACPQCELTKLTFNNKQPNNTILEGINAIIDGAQFDELKDYGYITPLMYEYFGFGRNCYVIPGDPEMLTLPCELYRRLHDAMTGKTEPSVAGVWTSMASFLDAQADLKHCNSVLIDTSSFYVGGTQLAWFAADELIVPIRADEFSLLTLDLLLKTLSSKEGDFVRWRQLAGGLNGPLIAAIVVTMVRPSTSEPGQPARASHTYIERAVEIAEKYRELFPHKDVCDAFVLIDDFRGAGRISRGLGIPLSLLKVGESRRVDGQRVEVSDGIERCQNQLRYLAAMLE
jgi:cellulose biosynthesis protein BcsQ